MNMKKYMVLATMTMGIWFFIALPQSGEEIFAVEAVTEAVQAPIHVEVCEEEEAAQTETVQPAAEFTGEQATVPEEESEDNTYREGLAAYITSVNDTVSTGDALNMVDCMIEQAETYDIDEKLILAVAHTESTYYSDAVSYADYKGLMQTGDVLAEEAGYDPKELFNPEVSIEVGAAYISNQLETFDDDVSLALTAYNQGPGAVYDGTYDTEYAEMTMQRVGTIEDFLSTGGYTQP